MNYRHMKTMQRDVTIKNNTRSEFQATKCTSCVMTGFNDEHKKFQCLFSLKWSFKHMNFITIFRGKRSFIANIFF